MKKLLSIFTIILTVSGYASLRGGGKYDSGGFPRVTRTAYTEREIADVVDSLMRTGEKTNIENIERRIVAKRDLRADAAIRAQIAYERRKRNTCSLL